MICDQCLQERTEACVSGWVPSAEKERTVVPCPGMEPFRALARLGRAKIPERYRGVTVNEFVSTPPEDGEDDAVVRRRVALRLSASSWVKGFPGKKRGLLLWSPGTGSGKTHLACASLMGLIRLHRCRGLFLEVRAWLESLQAAMFDEGHDRGRTELMAEVRESRVILLDELGQRDVTAWSEGVVLELVNGVDGDPRRGLIVTTNLSPDELPKALGQRIASRLFGLCEFLDFSGLPDWRRLAQ